MPHRSRRQFSAILASAAIVAACGGGSSDDGNKSLTHRQLYAAYDIVVEGLGLAQLVSVLGAEPNRSAPGQEDDVTLYTWVGDKGSYLETTMSVSVLKDYGVVGKTILGPLGGKTDNYF